MAKDAEEFDGDSDICHFCATPQAVAQRQAEIEKEKELRRAMKRLVYTVHEKGPQAPAVNALAAGLIELHGGLPGFLKEWKGVYDETSGPKVKLDYFSAISKMVQVAATERRDDIELETISKEDLEEAVLEYMGKAIKVANEDGESRAAG